MGSADVVVDVMRALATGDPASALVGVRGRAETRTVECEVLVVGGGTGGVAAAWAAARAGRRVCLVEETDWIGGQLTAQGVSALDEHHYIETFGGTRTYYHLREAIREHYRALAGGSLPDLLNPGTCWVTRLAFEPRVALATLEALLAPDVEAGRLEIFRRAKVAAADVRGERITSVLAVELDGPGTIRFRPQLVLDATELGDLLPLAGAEHVVGAEAIQDTGEAHAQPAEPRPRCVQSFTYTFALERGDSGERHVISKPEGYEHYRDSQPYTLRIHVHGGEIYSEESGWLEYQVFDRAPPRPAREPAGGGEEHRHDPHHERLLPTSPGGVEHRRGCGLPRRLRAGDQPIAARGARQPGASPRVPGQAARRGGASLLAGGRAGLAFRIRCDAAPSHGRRRRRDRRHT